MNLSNLRTRIKYKLGRANDDTLNTDIVYALETTQDEIISQIEFPELVDASALLLSANTSMYDLPSDFLKMIQAYDSVDETQEIKRISPNEYKSFIGSRNTTGSVPRYYDIFDNDTTGANYLKQMFILPYPATILNGIIATFAQITGVPATFADYNTTISGAVLITDVAHGLETGMIVTIAGTVNYNGTFTVTKVDADNFYIIATYVAEAGGGTWTATGTQITDVDHGLSTDDTITIAGTVNYNGEQDVIKIDDDNFYIEDTYVAEAGASTKTWIKNLYVPFFYYKKLAYLAADADENILAYKYPNLLVEGACYYLYRDVVYRDQPEKIAFRLAEYQRCIKNTKKSIAEIDKIHTVLPKRLLGMRSQLYSTQYEGYTS